MHCSTTPTGPNANLINSSSVGPQYRALQIVSFFARHQYLGLYRPPQSELGAILETSCPDDAFLPAQFDPLLFFVMARSSHSVLASTQGPRLPQTALYPAAGQEYHPALLSEWPLYRGCPLNLKVRFTAWPSIFNLTYTRRSSFQPKAFQEKVHVDVMDRFTVCFFSLSTSVRRSDFSFNSPRQDAVSSKTTASTFALQDRLSLRIRIGRPVEHHRTTLAAKCLPEKRKHIVRWRSAFKQPCIYASTSLSLPHSFIQRRCLTPQNQDPPSNSPSESIFFRSRFAGRISDDGGWK